MLVDGVSGIFKFFKLRRRVIFVIWLISTRRVNVWGEPHIFDTPNERWLTSELRRAVYSSSQWRQTSSCQSPGRDVWREAISGVTDLRIKFWELVHGLIWWDFNDLRWIIEVHERLLSIMIPYCWHFDSPCTSGTVLVVTKAFSWIYSHSNESGELKDRKPSRGCWHIRNIGWLGRCGSIIQTWTGQVRICIKTSSSCSLWSNFLILRYSTLIVVVVVNIERAAGGTTWCQWAWRSATRERSLKFLRFRLPLLSHSTGSQACGSHEVKAVRSRAGAISYASTARSLSDSDASRCRENSVPYAYYPPFARILNELIAWRWLGADVGMSIEGEKVLKDCVGRSWYL
jgi:hypothetical protein